MNKAFVYPYREPRIKAPKDVAILREELDQEETEVE